MRAFIRVLAILLFSLRLSAQPTVNSFTPVSAEKGATVVINGNGFGTSPGDNIVYFGATRAVVSAATGTSLSVAVPDGATHHPISITVNGLTGYSTQAFIPTFTGNSDAFSPNSFIPKKDFTTGVYPHYVGLADFNGDNKTDVLVSRGSSDKVTVLRNTSTTGDISFAPQSDFAAAGNNHEGAAITDFDGDGKLDFVITNSHNQHSVSIYRNTTTGSTITFAPKMDLPADNSPYAVATADLDLDGKPDLVIVNAGTGSDKISVYKNTSTPGNLSFAARVDFATGTSPYSIAIADLNNDGRPDLAVTTQYITSSLSVLKNTTENDVISFQPPVDFASFPGPFTVAVGDLNDDGKPDLAAASSGDNTVVVLTNTGIDTNFSFTTTYFSTGIYPRGVSIADMNGDGKPDLVTTNWMQHTVSVLNNKSEGLYISFDQPVNYTVGENPGYVTTGDLDGDGRPEIISANTSDTAISVLRNIVALNITPVITSFTPASGIKGTAVTIRGENFTGTTSVKFGNIPASSFTIDSATGITAIIAEGESGDVSVTNSYGTATKPGFIFNGPIIYSFSPMVANTGSTITITGTNFTGATQVSFGATPAASFTVVSATTITAIVGAGSGGSVAITTPNGIATLPGFVFGKPTITSIIPLSGPVGSTVIITGTNFSPVSAENIVFFGAVKAEVTAAASTHLAVIVPSGASYQPVSATVGNLTAFSSLPFSVSFVADNPTITTSSFEVVGDYGSGAYPSAISLSDLNDDGKPDIITANSAGNNISILKNTSTDGKVSFHTKVDLSSGPDPKRIAVGDLDGDGRPDIVTANMNAGNASTISVFRNTSTAGNISFAGKNDISSGNGSIGIAIADLDADGKPDIIVTSGNSGFFSIFKNTTATPGNISFAPKLDITHLGHADGIVTADLNNDGLPDLILSNFSQSTISVYTNQSAHGVITLGAKLDLSVGAHPGFMATADLDGDEKLDVLVRNYSTGTISVFKNNSVAGSIYLEAISSLPFDVTNLAISDLNGDGRPDLATGKGLTGQISLYENLSSGIGQFSFGDKIEFTTGSYDTFIAAGDLDGDGKPELAVANTIQNKVTILKNKIDLPVIDSVSVVVATRGATVEIAGQRFAGTTSVKFGGTPAASFTVHSAEKISAVVDGGASGDVTIAGPQGIATIAGFRFTPEVTAGGPVNFCSGGSVTLSSSAGANNQWYRDDVAIGGAVATTLVVTGSGSYSVKTTSNGITTTSPSAIAVTATVIPVPVITRNSNNQLVSSIANGNQWFLDGNAIPGATGAVYQPGLNGNYTVTNTVSGCTSLHSAAYNFLLTGIINLDNDQYIKLFPNPVRSALHINFNVTGTPLLNIHIIDLMGKTVVQKQAINSGHSIDLSALPAGVYFVRIYDRQLKINETVKIVRQE